MSSGACVAALYLLLAIPDPSLDCTTNAYKDPFYVLSFVYSLHITGAVTDVRLSLIPEKAIKIPYDAADDAFRRAFTKLFHLF